MNISEILTALLRAQITETEVEAEVIQAIDEQTLPELYALAKIHDVTHIIVSLLVKSGVIKRESEAYDRFAEEESVAFFRYKRLEGALRAICDVLEEAKIKHIALKGSVIRAHYPSPWMRTSADIDILVPEASLDEAISALGHIGYAQRGRKNFHDVSLFSDTGIHLELHFSIKENIDSLDAVLGRVWEFATPVSEGAYEYRLTNEFFAFHIITHMAYHFINGGCGVKPFMDLWILKDRVGYDEALLLSLLEECSMKDFYKNAKALSQVWFTAAPYNDITLAMSRHVLLNSICKDVEKGIVVKQSKQGGRGRYIFSRIFAPYRLIKIRYPIVAKHPYLFPVFEVVRWFSFLFGSKDRAKKEMRDTAKVSKKQMTDVLEFLSAVGLEKQL